MKKLFFITLTFSMFYANSQTITTSNKAIFDGANVDNPNEKILTLGLPSNGGQYTFETYINNGTTNYKNEFLDSNGVRRMLYSGNVGATFSSSVFIFSDTNSRQFYNLFDYPEATFMSLNRPDYQLVLGSGPNFGAFFSSSTKFIVNSGNSYFDGNVGIGTNSYTDNSDNQEYKLSVEGRIRAHALKVYTTWADYVFEKAYILPSLEEVEKHIKEKGHLKDIPSAKEVEANGIDVGEMNKLLLQKIEELTLYTIEQQKQINELKTLIKTKKNE